MTKLRLLFVILTALCGLAMDTPFKSIKMFSKTFGCFNPGGKIVKTTARISRTREYAEYDEQEVYRDMRVDTDGYSLKVPSGKYRVELKFAEIEHDAAGRRVFGVKVQGTTVVERLDIFTKVGKNSAYQVRSSYVAVTNGILKIEFVRMAGSPCIAAISVGGEIAGAENKIQRVFYQHINCGGPAFRGYYADFAL